jgi:hypothetical protein
MSYSDRLSEMPFARIWSELRPLTDCLDPFDFMQRMAAYKLLIDSMNARGVFGARNEMNPFWGYVQQLEWQWRSGRLRRADTPEGRIDAQSWWGSCNYSLSIIPLIAAVQAGVVDPIEIKPPEVNAEKFARSGGRVGEYVVPSAYDEALHEWRIFFEAVKTFPLDTDIEPLRFKVWHAHLIAITAAGKLYAPEAMLLPKSEREFGAGWVRMVDFLGVAAWRTDLAFMLEYGTGVLPERMMTEQDVPGQIADMNPQTNSNLINIFKLGKQSKLRYSFNLFIWKRAMRTRRARCEAPQMLDATFNPTPQNLPERQRLKGYIIQP